MPSPLNSQRHSPHEVLRNNRPFNLRPDPLANRPLVLRCNRQFSRPASLPDSPLANPAVNHQEILLVSPLVSRVAVPLDNLRFSLHLSPALSRLYSRLPGRPDSPRRSRLASHQGSRLLDPLHSPLTHRPDSQLGNLPVSPRLSLLCNHLLIPRSSRRVSPLVSLRDSLLPCPLANLRFNLRVIPLVNPRLSLLADPPLSLRLSLLDSHLRDRQGNPPESPLANPLVNQPASLLCSLPGALRANQPVNLLGDPQGSLLDSLPDNPVRSRPLNHLQFLLCNQVLNPLNSRLEVPAGNHPLSPQFNLQVDLLVSRQLSLRVSQLLNRLSHLQDSLLRDLRPNQAPCQPASLQDNPQVSHRGSLQGNLQINQRCSQRLSQAPFLHVNPLFDPLGNQVYSLVLGLLNNHLVGRHSNQATLQRDNRLFSLLVSHQASLPEDLRLNQVLLLLDNLRLVPPLNLRCNPRLNLARFPLYNRLCSLPTNPRHSHQDSLLLVLLDNPPGDPQISRRVNPQSNRHLDLADSHHRIHRCSLAISRQADPHHNLRADPLSSRLRSQVLNPLGSPRLNPLGNPRLSLLLFRPPSPLYNLLANLL